MRCWQFGGMIGHLSGHAGQLSHSASLVNSILYSTTLTCCIAWCLSMLVLKYWFSDKVIMTMNTLSTLVATICLIFLLDSFSNFKVLPSGLIDPFDITGSLSVGAKYILLPVLIVSYRPRWNSSSETLPNPLQTLPGCTDSRRISHFQRKSWPDQVSGLDKSK